MGKVVLKVLLPRNRDREGAVTVEVNGQPVRTFKVLGRGSAGGGDTQFKHNGNTPTGLYDGSTWIDTSKRNQSAYGPNGAVVLKPLAGNGTTAYSKFHRNGLLIHGGHLDSRRDTPWYGSLSPTNGCLRLRNEDVKSLAALLYDASLDETTQTCARPQVWVNIQEGAFFDDSDDEGANQCSLAPYSVFGYGETISLRR